MFILSVTFKSALTYPKPPMTYHFPSDIISGMTACETAAGDQVPGGPDVRRLDLKFESGRP